MNNATSNNVLKLLTYNTHLFKGTLADCQQTYLHKREVVYRDDDRVNAIVENIKKTNADIVCLQEVWGEGVRSHMEDNLRSMYPYSFKTEGEAVSDEDVENIISAYMSNLNTPAKAGVKVALDAIEGSLPRFTDGLMVFSKYEIGEPAYHRYTDIDNAEDKLGRKGVITFSIKLNVENQVREITVATTHMPTDVQTDGKKAIEFAAQKVYENRNNDSILLGDFNVHYTNSDEIKMLKDAIRPYAAFDTVELTGQNMEDCYTDWPFGNTLTAQIEGPKTLKPKDRIDYVCFSPSVSNQVLTPGSVEVPKDWMISDSTGMRSKSAPSLAVFQNKLYCSYQGKNDDYLWFSYFDKNRWSNDHRPYDTSGNYLDIRMSDAPSLAVFCNKLYCIYKGENDNNLRYTTFDGYSWTAEQTVSRDIRSSNSPALAVLGDALYCVYKGDNDNNLYFTKFHNNSWDDEKRIRKIGLKGAPALTVFDGKIYCAYRGNNDRNELWYTTFDGNGWDDDTLLGSSRSQNTPALAVFQNKLYCVLHGENDNNLWFTTFGGTKWADDHRWDNVRLKDAPALANFDNKLFNVYQCDNDSSALWYTTFDGSLLNTDQPTSMLDLSDHNPVIAHFTY